MSNTTKTAISMPNDLYETAQRTAKEQKIPFSTFISNCVKSALTGQPMESGGEPGIPSSLIGEVSELRSLVEHLTGRLSALEKGIPPEEVTSSIDVHEVSTGPAPTPRVITPDQAILPVHTPEVIPVVPHKMTITPDMREKMQIHISKLESVGMKGSEIARLTGMKHQAVSALKKDMSDPKAPKTIKTSEYNALMALQPITP